MFFECEYVVCHDPAIEGVGARLGLDAKRHAEWDYEPDVHAGTRAGWGTALRNGIRLCCTKILVPRTRDNLVDTSPRVIRELVAELVSERIAVWAEPLALRSEWLTSDVVALARGIHATAALDGLPALTDALIEAGCDDPLPIEHLTTCPDHGPSCWVVEMICAQAAARDGTSG